MDEQLRAIYSQTVKPSAVWILQCGGHINIKPILRKFGGIEYIHSDIDLKYFGRFSLASYVKTEFTWILDDDIIPGTSWLENSLHACKEQNKIVSGTGRVISHDLFNLNQSGQGEYIIGDMPSYMNRNDCSKDTIVDYGCNGWFFKTEWIKTFWSSFPVTLDMAEDIHLSATCKISLGIETTVLKQTCEFTTGNLKLRYGRDKFASWTKPSFNDKRTAVLEYLINELGWKPLLW